MAACPVAAEWAEWAEWTCSKARRGAFQRNLLVVLGLTPAFVACGGTAGSGIAESRSGVGAPPIIAAAAVAGRYVGSVTIDGVSYFGDALFTTDGDVRLYVGGPTDGLGGAVQEARPGSAMQFVGTVATATSDKASGHGVIIGQGCSDLNQVRFCGIAASAPRTPPTRKQPPGSNPV